MRWTLSLLAALAMLALSLPAVAHAELPGWLRKHNGAIDEGNALLEKGDAKGALAQYDAAARELAHDPGVQLNRGIALLKMGELAKAREALVAASSASNAGNASDTNLSRDVRADAYRNLALAFYRDGDALARQAKHDEAQKMFQEAADAAKRALRLRPEDPNAAWDLELAQRRLREEREKKKAEDEKKKQEQKDQQKDQEQKDQEQKDPQDPQPGDQGDQSQNDQKPDDKQGQDGQKDKPQDQADKGAKKDDANKDANAQKKPEPKPQPKQDDEGAGNDKQQADAKPVPADVSQALDSLENGEQNFERVRARQRAERENRAPVKDW